MKTKQTKATPHVCGEFVFLPIDLTSLSQGRFFTYPGDAGSRDGVVSRMKTDMCDPAGCLYELCLMLTIYMIGRQLVSNSMELYFP